MACSDEKRAIQTGDCPSPICHINFTLSNLQLEFKIWPAVNKEYAAVDYLTSQKSSRLSANILTIFIIISANVEDSGSKSSVLLSQVVHNHVLMFAFLTSATPSRTIPAGLSHWRLRSRYALWQDFLWWFESGPWLLPLSQSFSYGTLK